jgi:hypothetical protein
VPSELRLLRVVGVHLELHVGRYLDSNLRAHTAANHIRSCRIGDVRGVLGAPASPESRPGQEDAVHDSPIRRDRRHCSAAVSGTCPPCGTR